MDSKKAFKGFETLQQEFKMTGKMYFYTSLLFLALHVSIAGMLSYAVFHSAWALVIKYFVLSLQVHQMPDFTILGRFISALFIKGVIIFMIAGAVWLAFPLAIRRFKARAEKQSAKQHIRGSKLIDMKTLKKQINEDVYLRIGQIDFPVSAEPKHALVLGRPGVGKTVCLSEIIAGLRKRGDKALIYDFKGDLLTKFYDPEKDMIFNPLDNRCRGWNLFNEINTHMDIDAIAHSLIPPAAVGDPFWNDAARDVFSGILLYLHQQNRKSNADVWEMVSSPIDLIAAALKGTKGAERGYTYVQDASGKQALSVHAVMMQYAKAFEYMASADGDFSVLEWLNSPNNGFIFVTNYSDIQDTLRPILSLFTDLMSRKLLSLPDDFNRRVFFMLDEFGTLQRLSSILKLLTLSRSKGGSVWIGIQDIGQIDKIYGHQLRQAIVNAAGTSVMFAVADPDTAKFLSDKIGETEVSAIDESYSMGPEDMRDGISLARKEKVERLILPSEIINLPDLTAYVKLPNFDITKTTFEHRKYPEAHEPFLLRPDLVL